MGNNDVRAVFGSRLPVSKLRRAYIWKLVGRVTVLGLCAWVFVLRPEEIGILNGMNFFKGFSVLHVLWGLWLIDMLCQLIPMRKHIPLGSQKLFKQRFQPIRERINQAALRKYIQSVTKAAYKVMLLWTALTAAIGVLFFHKVLDKTALFMISVFFYVCDLICVLIWCPFRLIVKARCCTTCRIFNWDHLMMFSPLIFVGGFFAWSLVAMSFVIFAVWELCVLLFPERFWENSNDALKCANCTDKLCTQYCQKRPRLLN